MFMPSIGAIAATIVSIPTVWNSADKGADVTLSGGDLVATGKVVSGSGVMSVRANNSKSAGKFYFEVVITRVLGANTTPVIGVAKSAASMTARLGNDANGWSYGSNGQKRTSNTGTSYGSSFTTSDVIGVAVDIDAGKIWWHKNGTWQASGDPVAGTNAGFTGLTGPLYPAVSVGNDLSNPAIATARFTSASWGYTAPTGYGQWI